MFEFIYTNEQENNNNTEANDYFKFEEQSETMDN
jgi:hypothetical protein